MPIKWYMEATMKKEQIKIADVIPSEYSSFLLFCSESGKVFISELTNIDFVAFRTTYGLSRESVDAIRQMIENPVIKPTNYSVKSSSVKTVPDNDFSNTNKKSSMETTSDDHTGVSKKMGKIKQRQLALKISSFQIALQKIK